MARVNLRTVEVWTFVAGLALLAFVLAGNGCRRSRKAKAKRASVKKVPKKIDKQTQLKKEKAKKKEPLKRKVKVDDITKQARAMNSRRFARPSKKFRKIAVSPRRLAASRIRKTATGFEVRLPSAATVTTPAVYGGTVYVSGGFRSKQFYAFEATTGRLRWGVNLGDDGPSAPACEDGICVFNTESCTLFSLDAKTGKKLWSWYLGDPQLSAPTVAHGRVFSAYPAKWAKKKPPQATHVLGAFDLRTGKVLWQRWIDGDVMSAPVAAGKELYVTSFAGTVYKFDQSSGKILSAERARATSAPLIVANDVFYTQRSDKKGSRRVRESVVSKHRYRAKYKRLYVGKGAPYLNRRVQAMTPYAKMGKSNDEANGFGGGAPNSAGAGKANALVGQNTVSNLQAFQGSRLLHLAGQNYNSMGDEVVATHPRSGKKLWSRKLEGSVSSGGHLAAPPVAAGGFVFVGTLRGEVLQLAPATGKVVKRYKVGSPVRSQPVIHDGWIYVGTQNGRLVAINTGDKRLTGWTQWGGDAARTGLR